MDAGEEEREAHRGVDDEVWVVLESDGGVFPATVDLGDGDDGVQLGQAMTMVCSAGPFASCSNDGR
jgi:hypothetical protein